MESKDDQSYSLQGSTRKEGPGESPSSPRSSRESRLKGTLEKWQVFWGELSGLVKESPLKEDLKAFPYNLIKIRQDYLLESNANYIVKVYHDNVHKYFRKHYFLLEAAKKWKTWQTKFLIWLVVKYSLHHCKDVRYLVIPTPYMPSTLFRTRPTGQKSQASSSSRTSTNSPTSGAPSSKTRSTNCLGGRNTTRSCST